MKTLLILSTIVTLIICTTARCPSGCSCFDDSTCQYYCNGSRCQPEIPMWRTCSGHYIHPRECGLVSYCEPSTRTCELQKSSNEWCLYDYSCLSGYCDSRTNTCQYKNTFIEWQFYVLIPSLFLFIVFIIVLLIVIRYRQRRFAYTSYQNRPFILPTGTPYSYQNSYGVGEMPPPAYSGPISTPTGKPYQV